MLGGQSFFRLPKEKLPVAPIVSSDRKTKEPTPTILLWVCLIQKRLNFREYAFKTVLKIPKCFLALEWSEIRKASSWSNQRDTCSAYSRIMILCWDNTVLFPINTLITVDLGQYSALHPAYNHSYNDVELEHCSSLQPAHLSTLSCNDFQVLTLSNTYVLCTLLFTVRYIYSYNYSVLK